jgi:hypothetical protein
VVGQGALLTRNAELEAALGQEREGRAAAGEQARG